MLRENIKNKEINMKREEEIKKQMEKIIGRIEETKDDIKDEIVPGAYFYDVEKVEVLQKEIKELEETYAKLDAIPTIKKVEGEKKFLKIELDKINDKLAIYEKGGGYYPTEEMIQLDNKRKEIKDEIVKKDEMLELINQIDKVEKEIEELHEEEKHYIGAYYVPDEITNSIKDKEIKLEELNNKLDEYTKERIGKEIKRVEKTKHNEEFTQTKNDENTSYKETFEEDISDEEIKQYSKVYSEENINNAELSSAGFSNTFLKESGAKREEENTNEFEKIEENKIVNVLSIIINEREGKTIATLKDGEKLEYDLIETLKDKKALYKGAGIKEFCKDIAGGPIQGLLLSTKVNPAIVKVLKGNPEMMEQYIQCLNDKKEFPFELIHDLRDSKLGIMDKMKMWVHARAESKIPGTEVTFMKRFWNKAKALTNGEQLINNRENIKKDLKINNGDGHIEQEAIKATKKEKEAVVQTKEDR